MVEVTLGTSSDSQKGLLERVSVFRPVLSQWIYEAQPDTMEYRTKHRFKNMIGISNHFPGFFLRHEGSSALV
jgi:hypothetical protein